MELGNDGEMLLAGGRIRCLRCSAQSKRTKLRCGADAQACYYIYRTDLLKLILKGEG